MVLARLLVVCFTLVGTLTASADPRPFNWAEGTILVQGEKLFAKFANEAPVELVNLVLVPQHGSYSADQARIELLLPADPKNADRLTNLTSAQANEVTREALIGLKSVPASGAEIAGLKVVRVRGEDGSLSYLWVLGAHTQRNKQSMANGSISASPMLELGQGQLGLRAYYELKLGLDAYPNELAVVLQGKDRYLLAIHDDWASQVRLMSMNVPTKVAANGKALASLIENVMSLPSDFQRGRPFSESGQLIFNGDAGDWTVLLKTNSGQTFRLAARDHGNSMGNDPESIDYFERRKLSSRVLWEVGTENIRSILDRSNNETTRLLNLERQLQEWALGTNKNPGFQKAGPARGAKKQAATGKNEALMLTLSPAAKARFPHLRDEIAASLLINDPKTPVLYLKLPKTFDLSHIQTAVNLASSQLRVTKSEGTLPLVIIDTLDLTEFEGATGSVPALGLGAVLNAMGGSNIGVARYAVLVRPDQTELENHEQNFAEHFELSIDAQLSSEYRTDVLAQALKERGYVLERAVLERIVEKFGTAGNARPGLFNDLGQVAKNLGAVIDFVQLPQTSPEFVDAVVKLFEQINGERRVGPFPHEVLRRTQLIPRLLSASYPGHIANALTGRDELLKVLESKLLSWFAYGHREHPVLPLFFAGDNGTGKTMTANGMAEVLGAAVETVNLSAIAKSNSRYYFGEYFAPGGERDDAGDLKPLQEKIEKLIMSPNPVKILVLDELHTYPDILNSLLPALGNSDRKAPGVLNLDGIIVVMIANVDIASEPYKALTTLSPGDSQYPQQMFQLFKASLAGHNSGVDEKLVGALGGRLLPGMFFFPPAGMDHTQRASLVEGLVTEYESRNKMRLVLQPDARAHLEKVAATYTDGNFRSVERAVRDEITAAFGRFVAAHPGQALEGYFVLGAMARAGGKTTLDLLEVSGDRVGSATVVRDGYERFVSGTQSALSYAIETLTNAAHADPNNPMNPASHARRTYEFLLAGFKTAAETPLLPNAGADSTIGRLVSEIALPASLEPGRQAELRQLFGAQIRAAFRLFADHSHSKREQLKSPEGLLELSQRINRLLVAMVRLQRLESESSSTERPFSRWVESIRVRLGEAATGVAPDSIESLALAAGYLANDLARASAGAMLNDLRADAAKRQFQQGVPAGIGAATYSAECEKILMGARMAGDEFDAILGKRH